MKQVITLEKWKERVKFINPQMELLNKTLPKGTDEDPFICHCNICKATIKRNSNSLCNAYYIKNKNSDQIYWCPVCHGNELVENINDFATVRPELVDYFVDKNEAKQYTQKSQHKILARCPKCKYEKNIKLSYLANHGFTCPICSDLTSYPNKFCRALLSLLPVDYFRIEYKSKWTQKKRYDGYFILGEEKYVIEFDGLQHFKDSNWGTFEEQQANDNFKTELALKNGYHIIRIDCRESTFEYIKEQIFKSELSELFDLSSIDWNKCLQLSMKNIFWEIINYYKNNNYPSLANVANEFHLQDCTVSHYLRKADKYGLVDYRPRSSNSKEATKKRLETLSKTWDKNILLYNSKYELLKEFNYSSECADYLNIIDDNNNYSKNMIRYHARTGTNYNGYYIKYVNNNKEKYPNYELIKKICDYFLQHQEMSNKQIAKILNIPLSSVGRFLAIGANLKIIELNELSPVAFNNGRFKEEEHVKIIVSNNNTQIGKYNSYQECSLEISRIYLNDITQTALYSAIIRKRRKYDNFNYKFLNFKIIHYN